MVWNYTIKTESWEIPKRIYCKEKIKFTINEWCPCLISNYRIYSPMQFFCSPKDINRAKTTRNCILVRWRNPGECMGEDLIGKNSIYLWLVRKMQNDSGLSNCFYWHCYRRRKILLVRMLHLNINHGHG
jgi:hypothetical protein